MLGLRASRERAVQMLQAFSGQSCRCPWHSRPGTSRGATADTRTTDYAFEMATSAVRFGPGVTREVPHQAIRNAEAKEKRNEEKKKMEKEEKGNATKEKGRRMKKEARRRRGEAFGGEKNKKHENFHDLNLLIFQHARAGWV